MLEASRDTEKEAMSCASPFSDMLTREMLTQGFSLRVKGRGFSMYPFVRTGDTLLIEPRSPDELCIGDIIFYRRSEGQYVAHRLIKKYDATTLITKGDSLPYYDEPVHVEQVFGRVVSVERDGRPQNLNSGLNKIISRCLAGLSPMSKWLRPVFRPGWKLYRNFHK
jgi:signal peptidase I